VRALIVDDEPLARTRLRTMLEALPDVHIVGECESAEEALEMVAAKGPDVVFLDIQMPGLGGLAMAERLNENAGLAVVFVTAHSEHALKAFDLAAADYLLKPFSKKRLEETVERLRSRDTSATPDAVAALVAALQGPAYATRIPVPSRSRVVFVNVAEIDRVEADGNYVTLHVGASKHLLRSYLSEMEERLDPAAFVRIHRSHLVRRARIVELRTESTGGSTVVLSDGSHLPVGRTYAKSLLE